MEEISPPKLHTGPFKSQTGWEVWLKEGGGELDVLSLSPTIQVNTTWDERFLRGELKDVLSFVGHLDSLLNICASKWAALMPDGFWGGSGFTTSNQKTNL